MHQKGVSSAWPPTLGLSYSGELQGMKHMPMPAFLRITAPLAVSAFLTVGCVDPVGDYEEYQERSANTTPVEGAGCADADAGCPAVQANALNGDWLFALSAKLKPADPMLFIATIAATAGAEVTWQWNLQPLDKDTRTPLAVEPIVLDSSTIPTDGNWSFTIAQPLAVTGAANTITGSDIEAENVGIAGQLCGQRDFFCGDITGMVTKPIPLDLGPGADPVAQPGSTWTLEKLNDAGDLPDPIKIDCSCKEAVKK